MDENKSTRITIFEPGILIIGTILAVVSAAICMQIMGQLGIAPNTSLIGAVLIMVFARIPLTFAKNFRDIHRQNYVLSIASAAGFSAANSGFVAVATMLVLGRGDLVLNIAFATLLGSVVAVLTMGSLFNSRFFPARGAWPMGVAVATTIEAGDAGGRKGFHLLQGLVVGALASLLGVPAAGVGLAFIANMFTMASLGLGMILRGYSTHLFGGFDIGASSIAQGMMIGAGAVAIVQIARSMIVGSKTLPDAPQDLHGISDAKTKSALAQTLIRLFVATSMMVTIGLVTDMSLGMLALWVVFTIVASFLVMILVGTTAMHSGWAPTFALVAIALSVGMLIGFPPMALAAMVGFVGSVGLPFVDTGVGLKAGWLIRGGGADPDFEEHGRKQQIRIKLLGVVVGIAAALVFGSTMVDGGVIPPMSIFYARTIGEAISPEIVRQLMLWAIPGAILQAAFGSKSVGLMLAAGLLINNGVFGITLIVAVAVRRIIGTKHMSVRGPGLIAGDGLFGFGLNIVRAFF